MEVDQNLLVFGDALLVTPDREREVLDRFRTDPRLATISFVAHHGTGTGFIAATAPAGRAVVMTSAVFDLVGRPGQDLIETRSIEAARSLRAWAGEASDRGLRHEWWLLGASDVANAAEFLLPAAQDRLELTDVSSALHCAAGLASSSIDGLSITVDVSWLGPNQTGAQVVTTAAIEAFSRDSRVSSIRLVGLNQLPAYAAHLENLEAVSLVPNGPSLRRSDEGDQRVVTDVVWFPNQPDRTFDMRRARTLGRRLVVTYLDLIAYDIPRYHQSADAWSAYRLLQRQAALGVDGISAISADVAERLIAELPPIDPQRVRAVPLGIDHLKLREHGAVSTWGVDIDDVVACLGKRKFVLVLGNDFRHKNRDFAMRVWARLASQEIDADLVMAGLHVGQNSSGDREAGAAPANAGQGQIYSLAHVSPQSREWLLSNAAAILYPSSAEGFGLIPYEAAALGTPTVFTSFGPLKEISGVESVPSTWSIDEYAADLRRLLSDRAATERRVADLRAVIADRGWTKFADGMIVFFQHVSSLPPSIVAAAAHAENGPTDGGFGAAIRSRAGGWSASARRVIRSFSR